MPTGITAPIYDGKDVSLQDFILTCARQFGVFIDQRDNGAGPAKLRLKESDHTYYEQQIENSQKLLDRFMTADDDDLMHRQRHELEAARKSRADYDAERAKVVERYNVVRDQVLAWRGARGWEKLKDFAIEQLELSIKHDGPTGWPVPDELPVDEYRAQLVATHQRTIDNARRRIIEHQQATDEHNVMVLALAESLGLEVEQPVKAAR